MKYTYKLIIGLLLLLSHQVSFSQDIILNYDWEKKPIPTEITEDEKDFQYIVVKEKVMSEIFYLDNGNAVEYYLYHTRKKIITEDALDENNKVYMTRSVNSDEDFVTIEKARIIKPDGKIKNFDEKDILEEKDEDDGITYRFFAFEGLEVGDEVEYFYIYPSSPRTSGVHLRVQADVFKRDFEFVNVTPNNLINKFKSYNGLPDVEQDSTYEDVRYFYLKMENIQPVRSEKFGLIKPNAASLLYFLSKNTKGSGSIDYATSYAKWWGREINEINYKKSGLKKFMKGLKLASDLSQEEKVRKVEDYVKKNINVLDISIDVLGSVNFAVTKKLANQDGITKVLAGIYNELNIPYEIVYTTDRSKVNFDPDFLCPFYFNKILIYFPGIDKYLSPVGLNYRLGYPPTQYINQDGLFIRFVDVAELKSALGKVKFIKPYTADNNIDIFRLRFEFEDLPTSSRVFIEREFTGLCARDIQLVYNLMSPDNRKEMTDIYATFIDEDLDIEKVKIKNTEVEDFDKKPLKMSFEGTTKAFIETAGDEYIFKVGELIGPQSEMYDENERQLPIYRDEHKTYKRYITIVIPKGYTFDNLDSLNIKIEHNDDKGKKDIGFVSSYKIEGNELIIECEEYYYSLTQPIDKAKEFIEVINAAADFNKINLILRKI